MEESRRGTTVTKRGRGAPWLLVVVTGVAALLGGAAQGANLTPRAPAYVPTYEGRIFYIKPAGASCPAGRKCFCDSGTYCTLPGSGIITGTVVIDRSDVTLDCQNRLIQAPRFAGNQQCGVGGACGYHQSGKPHRCVNDQCQLHNLAGINVGGPLEVNDVAITIDVETTGYVQNVSIVNCVVRSHTIGYNINGFTGDNGLDGLTVESSEMHSNFEGLKMVSTDGSLVRDVYAHDNKWGGFRFRYNWDISVEDNTGHGDLYHQMMFYAQQWPTEEFLGYNRWIRVINNLLWTDRDRDYLISIEGIEEAGSPCNSATALCDLRVEWNWLEGANHATVWYGFPNSGHRPTFLYRSNTMWNPEASGQEVGDVDIRDFEDPNRVCWRKGNNCYNEAGTDTCERRALFTTSACWY